MTVRAFAAAASRSATTLISEEGVPRWQDSTCLASPNSDRSCPRTSSGNRSRRSPR
jgi:hypothetical protein